MSFGLLRAARVVAFKDSQPFRRSVFRYLAKNRRGVRAIMALHGLLGTSRASSLMVAGYGLKAFVGVGMPADGAAIVAIAAYRNEQRQIDWLAELLGPDQIATIDLSSRTWLRGAGWMALARGLANPRLVRFFLQEVHRINQRGDFLVAARVASTLGYGLRLRSELSRSTAKAALVSSDSNPYAMGMTFAAEAVGIPVIYVSHGHLPEGPPRTEFALSLLDGPACREVYERSHGLLGDVTYRGAEGAYRPMRTDGLRQERPTIGVFMSLIVDWTAFAGWLRALSGALNPKQIILRLHPNKVIRDPFALTAIAGIPGVEVSDGERVLIEDAARCDVVFAGNSSCHLSVLKYGVPTVYVRGMDLVPHDFYLFLSKRLIPGYETPDQVDLSQVADFYEEDGWAQGFTHFDASYPEKDCGPAVIAAIRSLLSPA
ncbi:MAG: hypothetical protein ACI9WU_005136 [Myxococcota bacterium]|jgi:hypothetical protein